MHIEVEITAYCYLCGANLEEQPQGRVVLDLEHKILLITPCMNCHVPREEIEVETENQD